MPLLGRRSSRVKTEKEDAINWIEKNLDPDGFEVAMYGLKGR